MNTNCENKRNENTSNKTDTLSNNTRKGVGDMREKKDKKAELALKKQTLEAWANLLYKEGMIDIERCSRMVEAIGKLKA